jgi:hypothetical protein
MNIYEVIFYETLDEQDSDADTIFLVRASDFRSAIEEVLVNRSSQLPAKGARRAIARVVYEIGIDRSCDPDQLPRVLRGPYFQAAYNFGWKSWKRRVEDGEVTDEWEEDK